MICMTKISCDFFLRKFLATSLLITSLITSAYANTFNVNQTTDGNAVTQLRGAILAADALGGGPHTINVPAGTYNLTLGSIEFGTVAQNISIVGAGPGLTIVNMTTTAQDRIFLINPPGLNPNVTTSISGIKFTNGKSSDNYGGAAILCGGPNNVINITNCAFEGNVAEYRGGGALALIGGGTLTVDNCTFTNNQAASLLDASSGGAILVEYSGGDTPVTGSATITNCTFTSNSVTSTHYNYGGAIGVKAFNSPTTTSFYTKIEKNGFFNNSTGPGMVVSEGGAIHINSDFPVNINLNAFSGNTVSGSVKDALTSIRNGDGIVNATNNWWGCNTDPQAGGTCAERAQMLGVIGTGVLTTSPWLVLKPVVTSSALCLPSAGQTSVAASFLSNSAGTAISVSNLSALIGLPVSFSAVNGNISGAQSTIQADGKATATYTASGAGNGSVNVIAGYLTSSDLTARATITTGAAPTIGTNPVKVTTCPGASSVAFSAVGSSSTTMSYQWYRGNTALSNDGKYAGVSTPTLTVNNVVAGDNGGQFKVKISNACGETFSNSVALNVLTGRLYVAEGASGEGSGWDDALGNLSNALNIAAGCSGITEIWVKAGTYKPSGQPYNFNLGDSRHNAFYLVNNVAIYGGFFGNETLLSSRNPGANQTILSGDIGSSGNADNCYHTIVTVNNNATARLDGFIVRDGNADGIGISKNVFGAIIEASSGGGMAIYTSSPVISNCILTVNKAGQGGGIYTYGDGTTPLIRNCVISDNFSNNINGGGIFNGFSTAATIQNCTISRNTASGEGAGVCNYLLSHPLYVNTVIWGNSGPAPAGMQDNIASPVLAYSLVQEGHSGTGILSSDALFVDQSDPDGPDNKWMTADDGLRLSACSPAVNTGFYTNNIPSTDILGQTRVFDVTADMGAYELQSYRDGSSLAQNGDAVSMTIVNGTTNSFLVSGCRVIAQVSPSESPFVSGSVQAKTFVAGDVISSGGVKFVQRHYQILPASNAESAKARIKLFFLQSEFDAFNSSTGGAKLPMSSSDGAGKTNLLVVQYHGTSVTGLPGSYTGGTTTINPTENDIFWNNALNRWEISFEVTGFSGFFITNVDPLPLKLISFDAKVVENSTLLEWLTAEEVNTSHFEIHRSADAKHWEIMPEQPIAFGSGGHRYTATDNQPLTGLNYYRLKMIDLDDSFAYSRIVAAEHRNMFQMTVYPNPATTLLQLELTGAGMLSGNVELLDIKGFVLINCGLKSGKATLSVGSLTKGIYVVRVQSGAVVQTRKVVIE